MRWRDPAQRVDEHERCRPAVSRTTLTGTEHEWLRCNVMYLHPTRVPTGHTRSPLAFTGYVNLAGVALLVLGLLLMA